MLTHQFEPNIKAMHEIIKGNSLLAQRTAVFSGAAHFNHNFPKIISAPLTPRLAIATLNSDKTENA
jgi:hypothetical protein